MKFENKNSKIRLHANSQELSSFNLKEIIRSYFSYWYWFLISVFLFIVVAIAFLRYAQKEYLVETLIIINDEESGGLKSKLSIFEDSDISGNSKISLINEIGVLGSYSLLENVIRENHLNIFYYKSGYLRDFEIFGKDVPFQLSLKNIEPNFYLTDSIFTIEIKSETHYSINDSDSLNLFGETVESNFCEFIITTNNFKVADIGQVVEVEILPLKIVTEGYQEKLEITPEQKKSNLLKLSLIDKVSSKAALILDNLIIEYNNSVINYKLMLAENTDSFINERISEVTSQLNSVDSGVESFKLDNNLTDMGYEAGLVLQNNSEIESDIMQLISQIKVIDYVTSHIESEPDELIPSNLGIKDAATTESTKIYNELLLERNSVITNSSLKNPTIINLDSQIFTMRKGILQSLSNLKSSLEFSLNQLRTQESKLLQKRRKAPKQEREYQDILRKQKIVETLYSYLLEKKEENAISKGVPEPNAKVLDKAREIDKSEKPNTGKTLIIFAFIGFFMPFTILYVKFLLDDSISSIYDLEKLNLFPTIGTIPKYKNKDVKQLLLNRNLEFLESFRLLRSNIEFSFPDNSIKTIAISSSISGEGKTFFSINLASTMSSFGKKTLLIEGDLRKPKLKQYIGIEQKVGLSNYLSDNDVGIKDIIHTVDLNYDIITSGPVHPNPTGILYGERMLKLIDEVKTKYDLVILDIPPLGVVSECQYLASMSDLLIYVVRANYTEKKHLLNRLVYLNQLEDKIEIGLLLNGTESKTGKYGYYENY